jgi:peroxiredoxin
VLVRSRVGWIAVVAGFVLATASTVLVIALLDGDAPVDGEFVLSEPGEFVEPVASVPVTGNAVPLTDLVDEQGDATTLAEFRGRPAVVNVWYSTCAPCARELRDFATVHAEVGDQIEFVGINPLDDRDTMLEFADVRGVEYRLLRDPSLAWVNAVPIGVYPTTLFLGPDGEILHQTTALDARELRATLAEVFPDLTS